ncbi:multidrug efflux pump subunit AcrB [Zhongshania antarctica]|uniref:Multidrug efflux pump subunit AcrB n=1 Tax=Zhongshania antarctica TaxID=641702 RepID=A0A840R2M9_9GAMM|nr:efflux RND transporter permease subunit [Zhongshania antarctica]MBB5186796.1 multidrug efflux pump subunit AcrB [Zhongshania antarctica]
MSLIPEFDTHKGIIPWFARNSVAANLMMIIIIGIGIGSALSIQRTVQPEFELNIVSITVPYPGATPDEVEKGVVLKIEEALKDIESIESVESTSDESVASLIIEIFDGYDTLAVMDEIKSAVDGIISFPEQAERPIVKRVDFNNHALNIQLYGNLDERGLKNLAEEVKQELMLDDSIAYVQINGAREFEISIEIPEHTLLQYGLSLSEVAEAIRRSSLDLPGGSIKTSNGDIMLRTRGQARHQHEFERLVLITHPDGTRLTLGDIATIRDGFVEQDGFSFFDSEASIGLQVFAVGNQDLITVANAAKNYVAQKRGALPDGVSIDTWADITFYLQGRMDMMLKNLGMGALLVFIVLGLFLNVKLAFWVMVGLPICFLGTFAIMPLIGISLNMLSLFGFILVLGIVVDDAIIIGESAYAEAENKGHSIDTVITGALRVATPATFGVLTTIMAFSPTLFTDGAFAPFPESVGWVVILCLCFSLIESKWILPAHLAHSKPGTSGFWLQLDRIPRYSNRVLTNFVDNYYRPFIHKAIAKRYVTGAIFLALLIVTAGLIMGGIVRFVMIPEVPSDFIKANLEMTEGTPETQTRLAFEQMDKALREVDADYQSQHAASDNKRLISHVMAFGSSGRMVSFMVELTKNEQRDIDGAEVARRWRQQIGDIPGAKIMSVSSADQSSGPAISFKLSSNSDSQLEAAAKDLEGVLSHYKGVFDIRNGASAIQDEIVLEIKPSAEILGINSASLGRQLRDTFYGAEAQRIQRGNDEVKVMVRYPREEREAVSDLQNMYIRSADQAYIPLSSVADIKFEPGFSQRKRIDGERSINVTAQVDKEFTSPSSVTSDVMANVIKVHFGSRYPGVKVQFSGESEEMGTLMTSLAIGFVVALFGIYALLAIPLRSYLQPFIIMGVIPFGIIGAVVGHIVLDISFSMMSFFGVIALSGVVVNDSLIMVDFINSALARGERLLDAVVNSGCMRFRAILLTSLTTFFGLLPMLMEDSVQAQFVIPMAVSLGFGIIFATVITLILIPCMYMALEDMRGLAGSKSRRELAADF